MRHGFGRAGALLWLACLLVASAYLGWRVASGLDLQTSLLGLLPRAQQSAVLEQARQAIAERFSRRIVLLLGHRDPARAHAAATALAEALTREGLAGTVTATVDRAAQERLGAFYFPYRAGLLSDADRAALLGGEGRRLADRAMGTLFSPAGVADRGLLARDPFLLMPSWFTALRLPQSGLVLEEGHLVAKDAGITWAFVSASLSADPFALTVQDRLTSVLEAALPADIAVLRTGAVFYAGEGARRAMGESSAIGAVSMLATVAMLLGVFRRVRPMLLGVLAVGAGIILAFAVCLWWFSGLHSIALLFGASLIGVAVDYALQYFAEYFDPDAGLPAERLRRVLPGVAIGLATTLIGYLTLMLAPVPGLRQIALFSVVGLAGSFLTVVLWYPLLDRPGTLRHGRRMLALADAPARFWTGPRWRRLRPVALLGLLACALAGLPRLRVDDDVRRMQAMSADLRRQEAEIERLTGAPAAAQFLLVRGTNAEAILRTQERLMPQLVRALQEGALDGFVAPAQFVPSQARQAENRELVEWELLAPHLGRYVDAIGFTDPVQPAPALPLLPAMLPEEGALSLVRALLLDEQSQLVLLQGVRDTAAVRATLAREPEVAVISLADDWSALFASYRIQAIWLLGLSVLLMAPLLIWRYRRGVVRVLAPSLLAVLLAPPIAALFGLPFTFFGAMALVLILSIGVDYAVFCAETAPARRQVNMLAVALAAGSTILSFGMLAASQVFAVHAFGLTMLIGITIAFLLAPLARRPE